MCALLKYNANRMLSFILLSSCANGYKLLIDCDPGGDDAMAILLALTYQEYYNGPEVVAITVGHGNTNAPNTTRNVQRILRVAQRQDIPVYEGADRSLVHSYVSDGFFGEDGFGDTDIDADSSHDLVPPVTVHAASAMIEYSKLYKGDLVVVGLGAATNMALAQSLDADFLGRLRHLAISGGTLNRRGNAGVNKASEFNVFMDVEAFKQLIGAAQLQPGKLILAPFSVILDTNFTLDWRKNVLGKIPSDAMRFLNAVEGISWVKNPTIWKPADSSIIIGLINPEIISKRQSMKVDVSLSGDERGVMTHEDVQDTSDGNANVFLEYDKQNYGDFLLEVFSNFSSLNILNC